MQTAAATIRPDVMMGALQGLVTREHADLYRLMGDYARAVGQGADRPRLRGILDELLLVICEHFRTEEALLLTQVSWECMQAHQAIHQLLDQELRAFRERLAAPAYIDAEECEHALDGLLIHHIMERPMLLSVGADSCNWREFS